MESSDLLFKFGPGYVYLVNYLLQYYFAILIDLGSSLKILTYILYISINKWNSYAHDVLNTDDFKLVMRLSVFHIECGVVKHNAGWALHYNRLIASIHDLELFEM